MFEVSRYFCTDILGGWGNVFGMILKKFEASARLPHGHPLGGRPRCYGFTFLNRLAVGEGNNNNNNNNKKKNNNNDNGNSKISRNNMIVSVNVVIDKHQHGCFQAFKKITCKKSTNNSNEQGTLGSIFNLGRYFPRAWPLGKKHNTFFPPSQSITHIPSLQLT